MVFRFRRESNIEKKEKRGRFGLGEEFVLC